MGKKNKKRQSRRMRKLRKADKNHSNAMILPTNIDSSTNDSFQTEEIEKLAKDKLITKKLEKPFIPFESEERKKKYQEITSHLKTVLLTSLFCIILLFSLYYFEGKKHWVEKTNLGIKNIMSNWDWKL